jgi:alpha-tubulin suppressor-like RCC1 family protein
MRMEVPSSSRVGQVACGAMHSLIATDFGEVFGCGLGVMKAAHASQKGLEKIPFPSEHRVALLSGGRTHSAAVTRDGLL